MFYPCALKQSNNIYSRNQFNRMVIFFNNAKSDTSKAPVSTYTLLSRVLFSIFQASVLVLSSNCSENASSAFNVLWIVFASLTNRTQKSWRMSAFTIQHSIFSWITDNFTSYNDPAYSFVWLVESFLHTKLQTHFSSITNVIHPTLEQPAS